MGEILNVVVAVAVVALVVRWVTSGGNGGNQDGQPNPTTVLGFRPRNVTDEMVNTVQSMFPDIPRDNIRYDLLRTGNTELTTNKILEKGFLEAPPAPYYRLYPRTPQEPTPPRQNFIIAAGSGSKPEPPKSNLINRFHLERRVSSPEPEDFIALNAVGSGGSTKGVWEDTPGKREQNLKERKERMILAARKRLLDQEKGKSKAV